MYRVINFLFKKYFFQYITTNSVSKRMERRNLFTRGMAALAKFLKKKNSTYAIATDLMCGANNH